MHEERGFLYALREHPEDDVTRLVYADWLEERDDPRAVYLRGEVALARMAEGDDGYEAAEAELAEMREDIVPQWLEQAGKRWDVVLLGYSAAHEIHAIRVVREAVSYDPSEALVLVESAPSIIWIAAIRSAAEKVRGILIGRHPRWELNPRHLHLERRVLSLNYWS